ncbi:MAG: hypothetical protein EOO07_19615 [Chitinophagaceae bacterium]|nr:MAG: hypothetical protein EOO07_19615 [Chitinophagaceae bacterium]
MKLRFLLLYLLIFAPFTMGANMESPGDTGGNPQSSSAIASKNIDILHESILIETNKNFTTAKFSIEYHINTRRAGNQIPLIFYASEFREDFKVWVDNESVSLRQMPKKYTEQRGKLVLSPDFYNPGRFVADFDDFEDKSPALSRTEELKYFEINLAKGGHVIRVEYVADVSLYMGGWVNSYSVGYQLWPAKNWKSFGTLTITIDNSKSGVLVETDLGKPQSGNLTTVATWKFTSLPADEFTLFYEPKIPALATLLIEFSPTGMMLTFGLFLFILHRSLMKKFRKNHPHRRFSKVMIVGSIVLPFIFLFSYLSFHSIIDTIIGEEATGRHGYIFFIMVLYPFIMPVYWILMWLIDRKLISNVRN